MLTIDIKQTLVSLAVTTVLAMQLTGCGGGSSGAAAPAAGRSYYVDAQFGDDGNDGNAGAPLQTIGAGISRLAAGDTLLIRGGNYRGEGTLVISKTARPDNPVVIASQSGGVLVDSVRIESSAWVEVRGLTIVSGKNLPPEWPDMPAVMIDNSDPQYAIDPAEDWSTRAIKVDTRYHSYSTFVDPLGGTGSWEYALNSDGINVVASQHISLIGNTISLHTAGINLRNESSDILVEANTIRYCLDGVRGDKRAIDNFSYADSTIRGNYLTQTFREGIRLNQGASGNTVEDNLVENTGHSHIATWHAGGGNTIRHNVLRQGGYYAETMQWPGPSAISVHSAGPATVVDGNSIALQVDATLNDGNGVIVDNNNGAMAIIANNLIYRVMGSGISSVLSGNATLIHNTIVESGYGTTSATNGMGLRFSDTSDVDNTIANNIIVNPANGGIWFRSSTLAGQTFIDNNLYDFSGLPLVADGAVNYTTLVDWQATGNGLLAVVGSALLEDPANGLFGVQAGSATRMAATTAHSIAHDREETRRSDTPTIGAYEDTSKILAQPHRFLFGLHADSSSAEDFVAVTSDVALISQLRAELGKAASARTLFITGPIERGGLGHNKNWDWHFVPEQWGVTEMAIELCDGTPTMVDAELAYWIDTVGTFCPWDAYVKAEL